METVCLMLADEHPLIQLGFRGSLRLEGDLEVVILACPAAGGPCRELPRPKRRALELIAAGAGPFGLAEGLGMCLERAEALHEELSTKLGLARIARQVRSAIRAASPGADAGAPPPPGGGAPAAAAVNPEGNRAMDDDELVRVLFPDALARPRADGTWEVVTEPADPHRLGDGRSGPEAWASAAHRLNEDEWFRPIIQQLIAGRDGRRQGA